MKALGRRTRQAGTTAVEFAVVAALFFTILIGIMEMGRMLWTWNAGVEATRLGARLAVVCSQNDPIITARMRQMLPALATSNISVEYLPGGCSAANCQSVRVRLSGYTHSTFIPFIALSLPIPNFQTTLPRESMDSTNNPVCS